MTIPQAPYTPPPPAKKGLFTLPRVLIGVGLVLALCCGGLAFGGYKLFDTVKDALAPARDAAVAFLDEVEDGDDAGAYAMFCEDMQATATQSQFTAGVEQRGRTKDHKITGVSVSTVNGVSTGTVTATLTEAGGGTRQTVIVMAKEAGTWKVCSNPF
ncbi:hypothetical protein HDA40_007842 [Hamadaea flava]|uniref:DUF4878 domain-containing protein n=1 Tax=Hamadaea flava TaxID=1742688 RepID=A0ABV8LY09_9ACTN|nr:DUF4878 domain-containing protein [Hamadaea flava]MCP2329335.1 hypothetical protein [Hamadaea flava]